jgi:predicted lipoprotein with Yx(FWY)xxD motif
MTSPLTRPQVVIGTICVALTITGLASSCGGSSSQATPTSRQSTPTALGSRSLTQLGPALIDGAGDTLYIDTEERNDPTACNSTCQAAWPAVTSPGGQVTLRAGVSHALVGSVAAKDGPRVITYNGYPLHTYAGDSTPGQANGEGVQNVWYVISPSGTPIRINRTGTVP